MAKQDYPSNLDEAIVKASQEYLNFIQVKEQSMLYAETEFCGFLEQIGIDIPFEQLVADPLRLLHSFGELQNQGKLTDEHLRSMRETRDRLLQYLQRYSQARQEMAKMLGRKLPDATETHEIFERDTVAFLLDYTVFTIFPDFLDPELR
jgi:hypothetical protein